MEAVHLPVGHEERSGRHERERRSWVFAPRHPRAGALGRRDRHALSRPATAGQPRRATSRLVARSRNRAKEAAGCVLPGAYGRTYYPAQRAPRTGSGAPQPCDGFHDAAIHAPGHQVVGKPRRHHRLGAELRGLGHQRRVHRRQPVSGRDRGRGRRPHGPVRPPVPARPAARARTLRPPRSHPRRGPPGRAYGPGP